MGPADLAIPGEENAERAGLPPPGPIVPDPMVGPPVPNPTLDNIMAGMPPASNAPAAPDLPVPDAALAPAPGADPLSSALAEYKPPDGADMTPTVPGAAPASPGTAPGAPAAPDGPKTASAVPVAEDVIKRQGALNGQIAQDKADEAKRASEEAILHQQDTQDALDHGNARIAERQKHYDDALDRYSGMKSYEYFDPQNPNKHSKLMAGLSIAFGGLGGGGTGDNHSLEKLQNRINDDWKHQNENIGRARDSVVMARTGIEDAKDAKKALLEDNNARRVAMLDSMQAEARSQLAERGVPQAQIDTDQRILDLQATRNKAAQTADEQRRKDALTEAQTKYLEARAAREQRNAKGGGAGGGQLARVTELLNKSGGEITPEVAEASKGMKQTDLRGLATQAKGDRRVDLQERRAIDGEANKFATENNLPTIVKTYQVVNKVDKLLNDPNVDSLTQITALMELDKASKGGTATKGSLDAALSHMAGGEDKIDQFFEKVKTGGLSDEQKQTLRTAARAQLSAVKEEGNTVHEAWNQTFRNMDSYPDQKAIDRLADSNFGALGYKRPTAASKSGEKAPSAPVPGSPEDPLMIKAQRAIDDPKAPPQAKAAALLYKGRFGPMKL